jgi:hypothetical protein
MVVLQQTAAVLGSQMIPATLAIGPSFNSPLHSLRRSGGVTLMLACDAWQTPGAWLSYRTAHESTNREGRFCIMIWFVFGVTYLLLIARLIGTSSPAFLQAQASLNSVIMAYKIRQRRTVFIVCWCFEGDIHQLTLGGCLTVHNCELDRSWKEIVGFLKALSRNLTGRAG